MTSQAQAATRAISIAAQDNCIHSVTEELLNM